MRAIGLLSKKNVISLVLFLAPVISNASPSDFIEGSSITLNTRQWYSHEIGRKSTYYTAQTADGPKKIRDRTAWLQGIKLDYSSGYTSSTIGIGLDFSTYSAISLERSKLQTAGGSNRLLVDKDGTVVDDWSKIGIVALKLKYAKTEMKIGRHQVRNPVMGYSDTRTLPASFDGISLENKSIDDVTLTSGYFSRATPRTGAGSQDLSPSFGSRLITSDWIVYTGLDYKSKDYWGWDAYASRFEDIWDRQYVGLNWKYNAGNISTKFQVNAYNTDSSGRELAGHIAQQAYGVSAATTYQNHTLTLALQKIKGDEYFDYVAESNAISLPNTQLSYYNGPNESSVQVHYINDLKAYGLAGFKTSLWYIKGWGINGTDYNGGINGIYSSVLNQNNESHYEVGAFVHYFVSTGHLKGASLHTGYAWHRASEHQVEGNLEEFRMILNIPLKIL